MNQIIKLQKGTSYRPGKTAFVLGGGGARGALQVGALQALLECGIRPQLLVGTSIGAIHASYLAINGVNLQTARSMEKLWHEVSQYDLLSTNPFRMMFSMISNNGNTAVFQQTREILISCGINPEIRFKDIDNIDLLLVAADLSSGNPINFGNMISECRDKPLLDAVLASSCLLPWMHPIHKDGKYLVDGGLVSELPIEPAVSFGASDIYALDLASPPKSMPGKKSLRALIDQVVLNTKFREKQLELTLAAMSGANVKTISLAGDEEVSYTDFHSAHTLLKKGYRIAQKEIADWRSTVQS